MEVAWSKFGAIQRMLEDFPLEISQRLICLVGSMGTLVVMQEQQWEVLNPPYSPDLAALCPTQCIQSIPGILSSGLEYEGDQSPPYSTNKKLTSPGCLHI
jgi:hypothetical protein